jgi:hypothetical protein
MPLKLPQGTSPWYPLDRKLGDPRAGLDDMEKLKFLTLSGLKLRPLSCPARRELLYRLSYRGSYGDNIFLQNVTKALSY